MEYGVSLGYLNLNLNLSEVLSVCSMQYVHVRGVGYAASGCLTSSTQIQLASSNSNSNKSIKTHIEHMYIYTYMYTIHDTNDTRGHRRRSCLLLVVRTTSNKQQKYSK
jgi:hypothetical protein